MGELIKTQEIKLLALDIDGTLFNSAGEITTASIAELRKLQERKISIVLASGRDYNGMPWEQLKEISIDYVITTNGSAVYQTGNRRCLQEICLEREMLIPIFQYLLKKEVYLSVFIDGVNYTPTQCLVYLEQLELPDYVKESLRENCHEIEGLVDYIQRYPVNIQKVTLNFSKDRDGTYHNREEVKQYLEGCPYIHVVDGGFANLEFTKAGVSKKTGLLFLTEYLDLSMNQVLAIGDSENDLEMLEAAGTGVAMGNAASEVKRAADDITAGNDEEGVALAIRKYF